MRRYSIEPRTRKYVKGFGFLSFARNLSNKYGKQLLDTAAKTEINALKTASQKVIHEATEATGEFLGNKIADKIVKWKNDDVIIPPEKREEILNKLRQVLQKSNT